MDAARIDGNRLWQSLMTLGEIGGTDKGGVCRLALSDEDKIGRELFATWCREAGCTITVDAMGSMFARRPGRDPKRPPILIGSHLDSQPTGGRFDGAYGVMAGLEVIRTLNDAGMETEAAIEVVNWTNEEGSRFQPPMVASGVFAGVFDLDWALAAKDLNGQTLGAELSRIGYAGSAPVGGRPVRAYFEAHIEQGPILEDTGTVLGVVTGAQGQRWYEVTVTGQEAHAGPTPMPSRRDALVGAARMVADVRRIGLEFAPHGRSTCGFVEVFPNSRNVIPGRVFFTIDLRNPDDEKLAAMDVKLHRALEATAAEEELSVEIEQCMYFPAQPFDTNCVTAVRNAAESLDLKHMDIVSGAGHDAVYMARAVPAAMIFVPCEGGISHAEIENAKSEDLTAGCNVLFQAVLATANEGRA